MTLYLGDCREVLTTLASASVDAVITDPPYAEVDRPYGRFTETTWRALMDTRSASPLCGVGGAISRRRTWGAHEAAQAPTMGRTEDTNG